MICGQPARFDPPPRDVLDSAAGIPPISTHASRRAGGCVAIAMFGSPVKAVLEARKRNDIGVRFAQPFPDLRLQRVDSGLAQAR